MIAIEEQQAVLQQEQSQIHSPEQTMLLHPGSSIILITSGLFYSIESPDLSLKYKDTENVWGRRGKSGIFTLFFWMILHLHLFIATLGTSGCHCH